MNSYRLVAVKLDWRGREWRSQVAGLTRKGAEILKEREERDLSTQGWFWQEAEQAWVKGSEQVSYSIEAEGGEVGWAHVGL